MKCNISNGLADYVLCPDNTVVLWICSFYCDKNSLKFTHTQIEIFLIMAAEYIL